MPEDFVDPLKKDYDGKDELDEILGLGDGFVEASKEPKKPENTITTTTPSDKKWAEVLINDQPTLCGSDFPIEYVKMVERIQSQYAMLPKLDYDAIDKEIAELSIKSCPTPTLQVLNDEIQRVQGAKDRLSDIFIDVIKVYNYKKRAVDILKDSWGRFTDAKNTEGRKGDIAFRLSNFELDFAKTEGLLKSVTHVFRNLDSQQDTLSRRITIYQLLLNKLNDMGRNALPDYDFDKTGSKSSDIFSKEEQTNKEAGGDAKLENF